MLNANELGSTHGVIGMLDLARDPSVVGVALTSLDELVAPFLDFDESLAISRRNCSLFMERMRAPKEMTKSFLPLTSGKLSTDAERH